MEQNMRLGLILGPLGYTEKEIGADDEQLLRPIFFCGTKKFVICFEKHYSVRTQSVIKVNE